MKTKDSRDPLDTKIDALLASRPIRPSEDFTARVIASAEAEIQRDTQTRRSFRSKGRLGRLLTFALPVAAAVVLTFSLLQLKPDGAPSPAAAGSLSKAEAQEIFLLEESLASFAELDAADFGGDALLHTFDTLYLEI
jgi:hypothetical protein